MLIESWRNYKLFDQYISEFLKSEWLQFSKIGITSKVLYIGPILLTVQIYLTCTLYVFFGELALLIMFYEQYFWYAKIFKEQKTRKECHDQPQSQSTNLICPLHKQVILSHNFFCEGGRSKHLEHTVFVIYHRFCGYVVDRALGEFRRNGCIGLLRSE